MLEDFLAQYKSKQTIKSYRSRLSAFEKYLKEKNKHINDVSKLDIANYLKNKDAITANNHLTAIKMYYEYILGKKLNYNSETVIRFRHDRMLSKKEAQRLLNSAISYRDKVIIKVLFETGIRVNELVKLETKSLKKQNNKFYLDFVAKGNKNRVIEITEQNYKLLKALDTGEKLINITERQVQRVIKKLSKEVLGREVTPHCFRHGYATELMLRGVSFDGIRIALGHTSITTTLKYLHNKRDYETYNIQLDYEA